MNIYVSNLGFNISDADLKNLFAEYGQVASAKVIMDRETGRSRGFGFVEIPDNAAAQKAMKELDGKMFDERAIKVSEARAKRNDGYSGGGGGGRY
jgi:RNA recognition motif-containing protein